MPIGCGEVAIAEGWCGLMDVELDLVDFVTIDSSWFKTKNACAKRWEGLETRLAQIESISHCDRVDIDPRVGAFGGVGFVDDRVKTLQKSS